MKNTHFFLLHFVLILTACNVPATTPAADDPPASTVTSIPVATTTPTLVFEATQTPEPLNFSPVLYGRNFSDTSLLLLGGIQGNDWLTPDAAAPLITDLSEYDVHAPRSIFQVIGNSAELDPICGAYMIETGADLSNINVIGVSHGWSITQRVADELSSNRNFYQEEVVNWLTGRGISNPVIENLQIYRVDIEGDGVDEVFISAQHFKDETDHMTESGDYSVILMRKVMGDAARTQDIVSDVYVSQEPELTFPLTYSLVNFIDLNQDGVLEVIVEINRWEGFGASVYQIEGQNIIQRLNTICSQ